MAEALLRALFTERQILGSADLNLVVDHERLTSAQTVRALTTAGVVSGLELTSSDVAVTVAGAPLGTIVAKQIRVGRGVACDDYGRLIVVPDDVPFGEDFFETAIGKGDTDPNDPSRTVPYPVFLGPDDQQRRIAGMVGDTCSSASGPTRIAEGYRLRIGRPSEALPRSLPAVGPADGPDGDGTPREILLGFVRYNPTARRYVDHADATDTEARTYAGIRADSVSGRHGRVVVRTSADGAVGSPVLALDAGSDKVLALGMALPQGGFDPLFSIDSQGNAYVKGQMHSTLQAGQVAVDSGVINHGLKVPLPLGITEAQVAAGQASLHITLTPLVPTSAADDGTVLVNTRCEVAPDRTVICEYAQVPQPAVASLRGSCRYLVIGSVSATGGAA